MYRYLCDVLGCIVQVRALRSHAGAGVSDGGNRPPGGCVQGAS